MSDCLMGARTGGQSEVGSQWLDGLVGRGTPMKYPSDRSANSVYTNLVGYVKPRDEFFKIFFIDVNGLIG